MLSKRAKGWRWWMRRPNKRFSSCPSESSATVSSTGYCGSFSSEQSEVPSDRSVYSKPWASSNRLHDKGKEEVGRWLEDTLGIHFHTHENRPMRLQDKIKAGLGRLIRR